MLNTPFSDWPCYTQEEIDAVATVLGSNKVNYWTGDESRKFEKEFAKWSEVEHAIALANGTVAIDLAFHALRLQPGDEIVVTPRTFLASVSSIVNAGAKPVFADVDPNSQNITRSTIEAVLTSKTRAILCVHLAGWPCDMDEILALAKAKDLAVVEDCAQAHGAKYKGKAVGSMGDIGCWSFCQDKIMTTGGEGGMVTTNNDEYWSQMWSFKDHGKSFESVYQKEHAPGFRWLHDTFGTNWRITEMQSAIGRVQLGNMEDWSHRRREHAKRIWSTATSFEALRVPEIPADIEHAAYRCYVFVKPELLAPGWSRDRIIEELKQLEVPCFSGSCSEVYLEKAFDNTDYRPSTRLPVAKELGETGLAFLVHPNLKPQEIDKTCEALDRVMKLAQRQIAV